MPYITLQSDWQDLADKAFKSVNGDKGGAHAPTSPIVINSAGMVVTGPTEVNYGGTLETKAGSRFKLGDGEYPKLGPNHVGRTRVLRSPVHTRLCTPHYHFADCPGFTGSLQTMALTILTTAGLEQPKCHIPLRVHDGARLASGVVKLRVPNARTKVPLAMPRLRVIRVDASGTIESLRAPSATVDADGYSAFPLASSGDAWFAAGAAQAWSFTTDQNNIVDVSSYVYYVQLIEEVGTADGSIAPTSADGTLVRERKRDVLYTFTDVPVDLTGWLHGSPPTPPGVTLVTGSEVLVAATGTDSIVIGGELVVYPKALYNGIWVVDTSGYWKRRGDNAVPSDFTPGFLVYEQYKSVLWECTSPIYGSKIVLLGAGNALATPPPLAVTPVSLQLRTPRGNIYHSIVCTFDQIADMRPQ
jgi:hypothetical protein